MKNTFKSKHKEITRSEMIIGVITFIIGGVGFICFILQVWKFLDAVLG